MIAAAATRRDRAQGGEMETRARSVELQIKDTPMTADGRKQTAGVWGKSSSTAADNRRH
jgi:hypothetical protein